MEKRLIELKDFVNKFNSQNNSENTKHYIRNYIWWNILAIELILHWIEEEEDNFKDNINKIIENLKKIDWLLENKDFIEKLESSFKNWELWSEVLLNLINNK